MLLWFSVYTAAARCEPRRHRATTHADHSGSVGCEFWPTYLESTIQLKKCIYKQFKQWFGFLWVVGKCFNNFCILLEIYYRQIGNWDNKNRVELMQWTLVCRWSLNSDVTNSVLKVEPNLWLNLRTLTMPNKNILKFISLENSN